MTSIQELPGLPSCSSFESALIPQTPLGMYWLSSLFIRRQLQASHNGGCLALPLAALVPSDLAVSEMTDAGPPVVRSGITPVIVAIFGTSTRSCSLLSGEEQLGDVLTRVLVHVDAMYYGHLGVTLPPDTFRVLFCTICAKYQIFFQHPTKHTANTANSETRRILPTRIMECCRPLCVIQIHYKVD